MNDNKYIKKVLLVCLMLLCLCLSSCESDKSIVSEEYNDLIINSDDSGSVFSYVSVTLYDNDGNIVISESHYNESQSLDLIYLKTDEIYTLKIIAVHTFCSYIATPNCYMVSSSDDILIERDESTISTHENDGETVEMISSTGIGYQISSENSGAATLYMCVDVDNSDDPYRNLFLNIIFED